MNDGRLRWMETQSCGPVSPRTAPGIGMVQGALLRLDESADLIFGDPPQWSCLEWFTSSWER